MIDSTPEAPLAVASEVDALIRRLSCAPEECDGTVVPDRRAYTDGAGRSDDAALIDAISALERLKGAAAAAQARLTVAFKASQLQEQRAAGVRSSDLGRGIGAQVALARRESPHRGGRLVGLADALVHEMPCTMQALEAGDISEWRATIVARETACLTREDRGILDGQLDGQLRRLSDTRLAAEVRRIAYSLDPASFVARASKAVADRKVTMRPAPDTMAIVSALLPVAQAVATYAALGQAADTGRAAGDERSRGQLMADTLVERVTGQESAPETPVEVQLVMTDAALLGDDDTPARLAGSGPVPAAFARSVLRGLGAETKVWIRRLFTDPCSGRLTAMDPHRRLFDGTLRSAIVVRDEYCRTPWCGAPIRHVDHAVPVAAGGETTEANAQGLCEACNYAKEAPGWRSDPVTEGAGVSVTVTTPTGHQYFSRPPPLPGAPHRPPQTRPLIGPRIDVTFDHGFHFEYAA